MDPKDDMLVAAHPASRDFAPPMTEKNNVAPDGLVPTPTECAQPRRFSDFATVGEALDYAAQGSRGLNYHEQRGRSEERRVGKECDSTCRSRWSQYQYKKHNRKTSLDAHHICKTLEEMNN